MQNVRLTVPSGSIYRNNSRDLFEDTHAVKLRKLSKFQLGQSLDGSWVWSQVWCVDSPEEFLEGKKSKVPG